MGCGASATKYEGETSQEIGVGGGAGMSHNANKIFDVYLVDKKKLGEGSYGTVSKCVHRTTKVTRALKTIGKKNEKWERFKQEIDLMKKMDYPSIIKLWETFEDSQNYYLVMELCTGGELFDRIVKEKKFTEKDALTVMGQMFRSVHYLHSNRIAHRDLKPENFIFVDEGPIATTSMKMIDFGLACSYTEGQILKTKAGTPFYVAPEVLSGKYTQACDMWSVGVIMYILHCGYPPFHGDNDQEVLNAVKRCDPKKPVDFPARDWKNVRQEAKELILKLICPDPRNRFSAKECIDSPWMARASSAKNQELEVTVADNIFDNLKKFRLLNALKKQATYVIARELGDKQIKELKEVFMKLDSDGDGCVTADELKAGLKQIKSLPEETVQQILSGYDYNGNGAVDYTEFLAATLDTKHFNEDQTCWLAFSKFDTNGDGKLSTKEIAQVIKDEPDVRKILPGDDSAVDNIMKELDTTGDGFIDFQEFLAMMREKRNKEE